MEAEDGQTDKAERLEGQGRDTHHAGDDHDQQGRDAGDEDQSPVDHQEDADGGGHTLAAAEVHIEGVVVPEDDAQTAAELQEDGGAFTADDIRSEEQLDEKDCEQAFQGVDEKADHAELEAEDANGVRGSGVAAAVVPDVDVLDRFAEQVRGLQTADEVGAQKGQDDKKDHSC